MGTTNNLLHIFGLHPLVGFGMFAVDWMLFIAGGPIIGTAISIPVGIALSLPCALIQRYGMDETWGLALGKGLLVGILTAIPSPIPSIVPLLGAMGGLTTLKLKQGRVEDRIEG